MSLPVVLFILMLTTCNSVVSEKVKRSDDVSLLSLQTLVQQQASTIQQQASLIQTIQTKLTALEQTEMATLKQDVSTMKGQLSKLRQTVAFTASFHNGGAVSLGNHGILRFDKVVTNVGNGYNPHTGYFTAPTSGLYAFFVSVKSSGSSGSQAYVGIDKSGTIIAETAAETSHDLYDKASMLATAHLHSGEQVSVRHISGPTTVDGWYATMFSGFLIDADM